MVVDNLTLSDSYLADILGDSWVADDSRAGYFLDGGSASNGTAFSLYKTLWNLKLAEFDKGRASRIDPARTSVWIKRVIEQEENASDLPRIGQIAYAVELAQELKIKIEPHLVERSIEKLRLRGSYRTSPGTETSLGSTALAVRSLSAVGAPIPSEVRTALERVFQQEAAKSPDEAVQTAVPLLEIASSMPPPIPAERQRLQDLYLSVDRAFSQIALDPVALASRFNARGAASRLKLAFSDKPPRECALVGPDGGVSLPGEPTPDLQSTYFAISFRCPRAKAPDRSGYSKAGWPNESVAPADVGSTASGMRIAALIGENAKYEKVLLPKRQTAPRNEQDPSQLSLDSAIQYARYSDVRRFIPLHSDDFTAGSRPPSGEPADPLSVLALLAGISFSPTSPGSAELAQRLIPHIERFAATAPIQAAGAWELASRITGDRRMHEKAAEITARHRLGPHQYSATASSQSSQASLFASALGVWINREQGDVFASWRTAGLCSPNGYCEDEPGDSSESVQSRLMSHPSLQTLALLTSCQRVTGCGDSFPVPL